jgi:hypothetical protein
LQQQQQQEVEAGGAGHAASPSSQQQELAHLTDEQKQSVFVAGIRDALAGGGCCASRAGFAGALLGALLGPGCIPDTWSSRCSSWQEVQAAAEKVCAARSGQ